MEPRDTSPNRRDRVRLGISACLLGERVRFDGGHKRDPFLVDTLGPFVEWVPVCPEVESGMGAPRESIRLVQSGGQLRLAANKSGQDQTDTMQRFARRRTEAWQPRVRAMKKRVVVTDRMQRGYVYWRTAPIGRNFAPGFAPDLTPKDMLRLGVFGGKYLTDCRAEFPASWFAGAKLCSARHDPRLNCFGVNASQSLAVWRRNGWIHPQDPRGWFQWYCRYYMGRRSADDARQIRRWRAIARHVAAIKQHCEQGDLECRKRQRQAVLHWAYDSRRF